MVDIICHNLNATYEYLIVIFGWNDILKATISEEFILAK
jgi:hypothetical protein